MVFYLLGVGGFVFCRNLLIEIGGMLIVVQHYIRTICVGFVAGSSVAVVRIFAFAVQVINIGVALAWRHRIYRNFSARAEI